MHQMIIPIIKEGRKVGNTTRLVDCIIQMLFTFKEAKVEQQYLHHMEITNVLRILEVRFSYEHREHWFKYEIVKDWSAGTQHYHFILEPRYSLKLNL